MRLSTLASFLVSGSFVAAQIDPQLTGTWSTKSNSTFTGPGFYDPVRERMIEPLHTGISYSFTDDGFYETAYYRALPNPTNPGCVKGMMQWQHGSFEKLPNGSLVLTPIKDDGRQLMSDPCNYDQSIYTHYHQPEMFERYNIYIDPYHHILRMNMFRFDGSPLAAMYLAFKPPQMLPTSTLSPTGGAPKKTGSSTGSKLKRALGLESSQQAPVKYNVLKERYGSWMDADSWWWAGLAMIAMGSLLYIRS